jgi:CheY-like chemotaxis protein/tetratricopeptide (TPR) repeat protein
MAQRPNILIIDPNTQDLQLLEISLRNMGFAVTTATNNFDALKKVEIFPPDLIISETHIEDFDGYALCRTIKENAQWAVIPFIFLSSDKNLQSKVKGLQLGVDDYLTKPIFLVELVARVRMLMQRKERESIERHESRTRFTGSIAEIGLIDIIQTVDLSKKKGVVHLARDGETGAIYFEDGNVIDAELAQMEGDEAVYRMMRWADGFFDIEFRPIRRDRKIELSSQQLLMEGLKRLDEWNRILEQLPPLETVFNVDVLELVDRLDEIPDEVNGLVAQFDGQQSLKEIVNNDIFNDLDTLRIVSKLIFFGVLVEHEQKIRELKKPAQEDILLGASEELSLKALVSPGTVTTSVPPADLQFGKAEEVDVVRPPAAAAAPPAAPLPAPAVTPSVKEPIARIAVKKIPIEVISSKDNFEEEITMERDVFKGREAAAAKPGEEAKAPVEEGKEETLKIKAAQLPKDAEAALAALTAKPGKAADEPPVGDEAKKGAEADREARTARMYAEKTEGEEQPPAAVVSEKKTARWTFPKVAEGDGKEEKTVEEKPAEESPRERVQAISLKEVKEEIEKREGMKEEALQAKIEEKKVEKKDEKKVEKKDDKKDEKKELSESGAYKVEEKAFFQAAPAGSEPVDTFEDLVAKEKKAKGTRGLTYAIWSIIIVGIAVVLFLAYGKDYLKQGPDLKLLDKIKNQTPVATEPLRDKPLAEVSPMESGEGKEGKKPEGTEETQPVVETGAETGEEGEEKTPTGEGEEKAPTGEGTQAGTPEAVTAPSGEYAALLVEAKDLLAKKDRKGAIEKYRLAVQVNPDGQEALSFLVDNYKEKPKEPGVLEWGKRATELGPDDARAWFAYGLVLFTLGKTKDAKPVFEHCATITPADKVVAKCKQMKQWVK